ncbi:ketoacyl-ACP synthase III [Paenibacillus sp. HJL G12]|uniref:Ketoacyl-ACP synthase III n=1 Tax=Paenibacillus dendrobii TaxID=2691084 RepID=A0A7X3LKM0_9BACL|nr:ketoacyl-ACP synthase III [Paenibacillus dendrobii]MWV46624.1 ketoacyl-ACP synthase III [Paenibacillus dendrobii]
MIKSTHVSIRGICSALPKNKVDLSTDIPYFTTKEIRKTLNVIGTNTVFRALEDQTTADLCTTAAEKVLQDLDWERDTIDALIFLSQTPDYVLPATSCVLQHKLGLSNNCIAFDITLGCSGYVYGLYIVSQLVQSGGIKRALLLVGDTISKLISPQDRSVSLLFGDAGSATALEFSPEVNEISFVMGTDGAGAKSIIVPAGGYRERYNANSMTKILHQDGYLRAHEDLYMNGTEVFNFTSEVVPRLISEILEMHQWTDLDVDYYMMHQANKFILGFLANKCGIDITKVPINIHKFGNTSSASIPLLMTDSEVILNKKDRANLILAGFGVGLSWGAAALTLKNATLSTVYV